MQVTAKAPIAWIKELTPAMLMYCADTWRSHRKYPAANPCTIPLAGVYPHSLPLQSISCLCSSLKMTHSAAAHMNSA